MTQCLNCGQAVKKNLSIQEILKWKALDDDYLCTFCRKELEKLGRNPHCQYCLKDDPESICLDCQIWQKKYNIFNQHFAIFKYNQFMHDYFKRYKRYGDILIAQAFESDLKKWQSQHQYDLVTYIPASNSHLKKRGFDPVLEMYKNIFDLNDIFLKEDADKPQAQKDKIERMLTPQTFKIKPDFPKKPLDSKVLILDDIYTTGRTLLHARQLLTFVGFQNIHTFSLTR
ncbi:ComF family protein [Companilactobacillus sp.]|uniref:ComF family protein n=1 Tax=Companilactobacillus sp. TaxID=2767905 RepID=UPI00261C6277|nr:ComF family protein [Companilactobacillus sp.]